MARAGGDAYEFAQDRKIVSAFSFKILRAGNGRAGSPIPTRIARPVRGDWRIEFPESSAACPVPQIAPADSLITRLWLVRNTATCPLNQRVVRRAHNFALLFLRRGQGLQILAQDGVQISELAGMNKLDLAEAVYHDSRGGPIDAEFLGQPLVTATRSALRWWTARKDIASSVLPAMSTARKFAPGWRFWNSSSAGNSARQGSHPGDQKVSSAGLPLAD